MTQENTFLSYYKLCKVDTEDFITVGDGVVFDTRLSGHFSDRTAAANSRKRKLSVENTSVTDSKKSNPLSEPSVPVVSSHNVPDARSVSPSPAETNAAGSDPNDISSFLILDSTLNQSCVESDLKGDLACDCDDYENEPPVKKFKGNENIVQRFFMRAEEILSGNTVKSSNTDSVTGRKKLQPKRKKQETGKEAELKSVATVGVDVISSSLGLSVTEHLHAEELTSKPRVSNSVLQSSNVPVSEKKSFCDRSHTLSPSQTTTEIKQSTFQQEKSCAVPSSIQLSSDEPEKQCFSVLLLDRPPESVEDLEKGEILLLLRFMKSGKVYFIRGIMKEGSYSIPFPLVSSEKYEARMFGLVRLASSSQPYYSIDSVSNYLTFTTQMTVSQIDELQGLAEAFVFSNLSKYHRLNHFYRNKPDAYFDDIFDNHNGVMKPYMKDFNGDQASPINGKLKGLFFSASVNYSNGKIPLTSCFGEKRLYIPGELLFSKDMCLYFTDFYCTTSSGRGPHYVTLVMTKKDSQSDDFCRSRLRLLNPFNNPFMYKQRQKSGWQVFTCTTLSTLHVEVFYTEEVDIKTLLRKHKHEVSFEYVETFGRGHSSVKGIPKNRQCPTCNIINQFPISSN